MHNNYYSTYSKNKLDKHDYYITKRMFFTRLALIKCFLHTANNQYASPEKVLLSIKDKFNQKYQITLLESACEEIYKNYIANNIKYQKIVQLYMREFNLPISIICKMALCEIDALKTNPIYICAEYVKIALRIFPEFNYYKTVNAILHKLLIHSEKNG